MQKINELIIKEAETLLKEGKVNAVLAWKKGEHFYDQTPGFFTSLEEIKDLIYDDFCGANLSKYLFKHRGEYEKIAVFLKPCDTYSLNELLSENKVVREMVVAIGTPCSGMIDIRKIRALHIKGITKVTVLKNSVTVETLYGNKTLTKEEILLEKCLACKGSAYMVSDKTIGEPLEVIHAPYDRFEKVRALEKLTPAEKFSFWQKELSKCIRCNACRDVCPCCTCEKCVFDNPHSGISSKANADSAEEQVYHIIRAYHVAGRCTDCGECSRVCPQGIPLELLNRKFIKDINEFYGEYQSGDNAGKKPPLLDFALNDVESTVLDKGGK